MISCMHRKVKKWFTWFHMGSGKNASKLHKSSCFSSPPFSFKNAKQFYLASNRLMYALNWGKSFIEIGFHVNDWQTNFPKRYRLIDRKIEIETMLVSAAMLYETWRYVKTQNCSILSNVRQNFILFIQVLAYELWVPSIQYN